VQLVAGVVDGGRDIEGGFTHENTPFWKSPLPLTRHPPLLREGRERFG
jgi:hypothetical protein